MHPGIFYPGGSLSNLASVALAAQRSRGKSREPVVLISNHCHYSIRNAVEICGIQKTIGIETTVQGIVDLDSLKRAIETAKTNGLNPIYFCCVLGATNLGSFDPVEQIHDIFIEYDVHPWIHFDAAWGGGVYFNPRGDFYREVSAIADSIVLDFHKFLSAPLLCSVLLVKDKSSLQKTDVSQSANYLFNNKQDKKYSLSLKSLQCSREAYAFKLWLMFKYHGISYFQDLIEKFYENQQEFRRQLCDRVLYVVEPQYFNICVWFIPPEMTMGQSILDYSIEERQKIDSFNLAMYEKIATDGFAKFNFSSFNNFPTLIRIIVHHGNLTKEIISEIVSYLYDVYNSA
ncbi:MULTISPECIES: pyridoxal-dependent decarboxylase [unclassified Moorena]|uniref:pyridoxal phosphate-dependent decarboxylase family protein n=1 Tax=unclassified Moorena TaxID=2683338 RepID=UPI001401573A|nr:MULTISPECIES: pyridoxal-dependent decarboxylase [unclassified Moorena]NEO11027.1 PLP-dependent decarboxylase [Moorena sp. SIO3E8]NEP99141.1 PLP-dependent decarboxylase [Moorena sp. SIO3F7]